LNAEGIKPRVLIIDDGWQMTHVDEDYEGAKTTKAKRLGFLGSRGEEFEESEQAVLSAYADALSGGTEMMTTMPALADPGARLPAVFLLLRVTLRKKGGRSVCIGQSRRASSAVGDDEFEES
jgi:hypothetical protein